MNCPQCKEEVRGGAQFCSRCGARTLPPPGDRLAESLQTADAGAKMGGGNEETIVTSDKLAGQVLDNKYELVDQLGAGGMGAVYRARRVHIGDEVAVKILHPKYLADESAVGRFRREARAAAQLHHPNVVTIHDYGETEAAGEPLAYIVMELVGGLSLRELLKREGRLAPSRAVWLMRDICAGVGAAHRRQIVHRDIKPDNIIVLGADADRERETVKVVDFGIAKLRDAGVDHTLTAAGAVIGTPYYMSPEQCLGEPLDSRADVYSLGALLYEMLAGTPPFTAPTVTGVIAKHLSEQPPPVPADVRAAPALAAAVDRALSKDVAGRQQDASDFARELSAAESAAVVPAPDAHPAQTPSQVVPTPTPAGSQPRASQPTRHQPPPPSTGPTPRASAHDAQPAPHAAGQQPPPPVRKSRAPFFVGLLVCTLILAGAGLVVAYLYFFRGGNRSAQANADANRRGARNASVNSTPQSNANANTNANANALVSGAFQRAETKILSDATVNEADLRGMTPPELALLRNVVYARRGRVFTSPLVNAYLRSRAWYRPQPDYSDEMLTAADRANVKTILAAEGGNAPDPSAAREEIKDALEGWVEATRARDIDAHMNYYADTLDTYYTRRGVARYLVRNERDRAFERYDELKVDVSNVRVTLDETGAGAQVIFDKEWRFEGERCSKGKVQQELRFARAGGRWLISGERDLKVYKEARDDCD